MFGEYEKSYSNLQINVTINRNINKILDATLVYKNDGCKNNIQISMGTLGMLKKPSERKFPCKLLVLLYLKQKPHLL